MLYPEINEARSVIDLSGTWSFRLDDGNHSDGKADSAFIGEDNLIAVPASYNDLKENPEYRQHCGWAYYKRSIIVPKALRNERIMLRFDAVTHYAKVYLDGELIAEHKGGFLPFEADITEKMKSGKEAELIVAVDNRINHSTLPMGNEGGTAFFGSDNADVPSVIAAKKWRKPTNLPNFDFFNYAGINRPVRIYTTPFTHIEDVTITTAVQGKDGVVNYSLETEGKGEASIRILDREGKIAAEGNGKNGTLRISDANLWWPYPGDPYLYKAVITYGDDTYSLEFGIRTVEVKGKQFLINSKPFYFKGFGKHEDSAIHGRGFDFVLDMKDVSMIHWMGANSFRTSHYPYAEEMYQLCDREGIVIIDETPAVGIGGTCEDIYRIGNFRKHHEDVIKDLIARDKNHPSVVMWSMGNEPDVVTYPDSAYDYWHSLYEYTKGDGCGVSQPLLWLVQSFGRYGSGIIRSEYRARFLGEDRKACDNNRIWC